MSECQWFGVAIETMSMSLSSTTLRTSCTKGGPRPWPLATVPTALPTMPPAASQMDLFRAFDRVGHLGGSLCPRLDKRAGLRQPAAADRQPGQLLEIRARRDNVAHLRVDLLFGLAQQDEIRTGGAHLLEQAPL